MSRYSISDGAETGESILRVESTARGDTGKISCDATNAYGIDTLYYEVLVEG